MKTAEEILLKHLNALHPEFNDPTQRAWNYLAGKDKAEAVLKAMEEYADQFKAIPANELPTDEITASEFIKRLTDIPNFTAKNIKVKLKDGGITIGEISLKTERLQDNSKDNKEGEPR